MRGPIADHRTCQPGRGQTRPARSEHADALARRHEPASSSLPGKPHDQLQTGLGECAANRPGKAYEKRDTGAQRSPRIHCQQNRCPHSALGSSKRSCLLGQGHRLRRLHAVAGRRDDQRDAGAKRIQGYTRHEIVGRDLSGSFVSGADGLVVGMHAGVQTLPMTCVTSTEPGLVQV
jgi:hypothetical protein